MKTILVGSSIFENWVNAAEGFPRVESFANCAIGGTRTSDWTGRIGQVLELYQPDFVGYYCGSNDILDPSLSDEETIANTKAIGDRVLQSGAILAYYKILKAPHKAGCYERIDAINQELADYFTSKDPENTWIMDFNDFLYLPEGTPDRDAKIQEFYVEDQNHLTALTYRLKADKNARAFQERFGKVG